MQQTEKPKASPYADLQSEIRRRKYPETYWVNWFSKVPAWNITHDNIRRCLHQNPCPEDRAALLWLKAEITAIQRAKKNWLESPETALEAPQIDLEHLPPSIAPFFIHAPRRPYCTDRLDRGLQVRPLATAAKKRYLQHNGPGMAWTLVVDVDQDLREVAFPEGYPIPNFITLNPANGHGHMCWYLQAGVTTTSAGRLAPLRYLAAVEHELRRAIGGDVGYAGLITKNPLHSSWELVPGPGHLWSLGELAAAVDLRAANARNYRKEPEEAGGFGRNVSLFNELRHWAYTAIREFWMPGGLGRWSEAVLAEAERINARFPAPLPFSEIKASAKSVSKWTWNHITPAGLQELIERTHTPEKQAERGKKATNQAEIAGLGGKSSGAARRLSREQDRTTARLMRAQGRPYREIATELGVSIGSVHSWCSCDVQ